MITLLFIVILTTFIGLGLPDSLLGSAWPAIYQDFNVPISYANIISFLISTGTVLSSLFSARLINKFGTGVVTAASTILTSVCILGFSLSSSIVWLCLLAFPLGTGAGSIDAALNNYVAIHYSSTHMSLLHTFYGVGVSLSPFLMSLALGKDNNWRLGYVTVFYILAGISLITIISLPLWKKIKAKETPEQTFTPVSLSLKSLAKMPAVRTAWIMFFASVALEFTCGIWGSSYMVLSENLSGIKVTQIFNQEERKLNEFEEKNNRLCKSKWAQIGTFSLFRPAVYMLYAFNLLLLFWIGGSSAALNVEFAGQVITGSTIVIFYSYIGQFFTPVQNLAEQFNWLQSAYASSAPVVKVTVPIFVDGSVVSLPVNASLLP